MSGSCPFCNLPRNRILIESDHFRIIRDAHPVSKGHTLVIPKRHIQSYFYLDKEELSEFHTIISKAKDTITSEDNPDGYNIVINDMPAAGQTVPHLHIHIIPRHKGDTDDPGGIRWVLPDKDKYWND